ncbi:MAG: hypothetical protein R3Y43_04470 [Alphaproteobacteria bacterium]
MKKRVEKNIKKKKISLVKKICIALFSLFFILQNYPLVVLFVLGMLPTLVISLVGKTNKNKLIVVGFMNLAGCIPYIVDIAFSHSPLDDFLSIVFSIFSWCYMYSFAALGFLFYSALPFFIVLTIKTLRNFRLKQIDRELNRIKEKWGEL